MIMGDDVIYHHINGRWRLSINACVISSKIEAAPIGVGDIHTVILSTNSSRQALGERREIYASDEALSSIVPRAGCMPAIDVSAASNAAWSAY